GFGDAETVISHRCVGGVAMKVEALAAQTGKIYALAIGPCVENKGVQRNFTADGEVGGDRSCATVFGEVANIAGKPMAGAGKVLLGERAACCTHLPANFLLPVGHEERTSPACAVTNYRPRTIGSGGAHRGALGFPLEGGLAHR